VLGGSGAHDLGKAREADPHQLGAGRGSSWPRQLVVPGCTAHALTRRGNGLLNRFGPPRTDPGGALPHRDQRLGGPGSSRATWFRYNAVGQRPSCRVRGAGKRKGGRSWLATSTVS
jgi:hypothetical protein